jgi:hypothetical protein
MEKKEYTISPESFMILENKKYEFLEKIYTNIKVTVIIF